MQLCTNIIWTKYVYLICTLTSLKKLQHCMILTRNQQEIVIVGFRVQWRLLKGIKQFYYEKMYYSFLSKNDTKPSK